jgi:hypothetical protein
MMVTQYNTPGESSSIATAAANDFLSSMRIGQD